MAVTPQTNTDLSTIAARLRGVASVAICGHVNPDGDCLGSQLALAHALRALGVRVDCLLAQPDALDAGMRTLPGADDLVPAAAYAASPEAFVAVDVPTPERLGDAAAVHARCPLTITIDHHAVPRAMSQLNYVDPDAPATAQLVWRLVKELGVEPTAELAQCAYAGLMTDTGGFRYQQTDAACFQAAAEMTAAGARPSEAAVAFFQNRSLASVRLMERMLARAEVDLERGLALSYVTRADFEELGAVRADAEPLVDTLRSIRGVRAAGMLREQDGCVRGSLRAKDETDVAQTARRFGGGGHRAAAGFTFEGALDEAIPAVRAALLEALSSHTGER